MDKLKYDYKAYFSVAKKAKFRVKSSNNLLAKILGSQQTILAIALKT